MFIWFLFIYFPSFVIVVRTVEGRANLHVRRALHEVLLDANSVVEKVPYFIARSLWSDGEILCRILCFFLFFLFLYILFAVFVFWVLSMSNHIGLELKENDTP